MTRQIVDTIAKQHGISRLRAMVLITELLTSENGPRQRTTR